MLVVQLHHPGWRLSTVSHGTEGAFFFVQQVSCLLDIRAELVVTSVHQETHFVMKRGETFENSSWQRHPWNRQEIMTIHRAVLLPSSNSAKFSYRDGWH